MGKINITSINTKETEVSFMGRVVNALSNLDSRIICNNTVENEYDMSDTSHVPTFDFTIDGAITFRIRRGGNLTAGSFTYEFSILDTDTRIESYVNPDSPSSATPLSIKDRELCFAYIVTDTLISVSLTGAHQYSRSNITIIYTKSRNSNRYYTAINTGLPWTTSGLFNFSTRVFEDSVTKDRGTFISRFSYAAPAGQIDYIKSSIYQNNNSRIFELDSIYDCTTVTVGDTVSLKDGPYLAVGTNQLIKV